VYLWVIDLHCPVLPGIDDGPGDIDGSIALARAGGSRHAADGGDAARRKVGDVETKRPG
jgi:hypothetical protein